MAKETKTARFAMRISPGKKDLYENVAKQWGYKSTSSFMEAIVDWAIAYEQFEGDYEAYLKKVGNLDG